MGPQGTVPALSRPQDEPQPCLPLGSANTITSLATPLLQHSAPPLPGAPSGSPPASPIKAASTQAVPFGVEASQCHFRCWVESCCRPWLGPGEGTRGGQGVGGWVAAPPGWPPVQGLPLVLSQLLSPKLTWVVRRLGRGCPSGGEQGGGVYEESPTSLSPCFPWSEGVGSQDPETRCLCGLHSSLWVCRGSAPATSRLDKTSWEGWL